MQKRKLVVIVFVLLTSLWIMLETAYGAPRESAAKEWDISFLGTLQVPAQLEIVDAKDVIKVIGEIAEKVEKEKAAKGQKTTTEVVSAQDMVASLERNNAGIYELALKNKGTYNIALVIAFKMPEEFKSTGLSFFDKLQTMDKKQQAEIQRQIINITTVALKEVPNLKDVFEMEVLEFYPFEQMTNKNAQIVSVGGSVAFRTYKIIQPAALKVYFIKKNTQMYVFGVMNSGPDRKMWDDMTKTMLGGAKWKILS